MAAQPEQKNLQLNELETLKQRLESVYDDARNNEKILKKFQYLELKLLSCSSLTELLQIITHHSRSTFGWDTLTITLHDPHRQIYKLLKECGDNPDKQEALQLLSEISHIRSIYGLTRKPSLGKFDLTKHRALFLANHKYPRSLALLPLQRNNCLLGSLNLGSNQADRFQKSNATDFLQHMAAVLATCLHTAIAHEKLKQAGLTDALTGMKNRRCFDQRLQEEISRNKRLEASLSCLFIDIDHFKIINDSYGHNVGDSVLKKVAELVRVQIRSIDVVARYGGEEFAVLLGQSGKQKAIEIAERISSVIAETQFKDDTNAIDITVSVGVSTINFQQIPTESSEMIGRSLLQRADKALYQAKQNGRNRVVFLES